MDSKDDVLWLDVKGYEGIYKISNKGDLMKLNYYRSGKPGLMVAGRIPTGYHSYRLTKDGKNKYFYAHRLVALHFLEEVKGKSLVNHIDHNPANNSVENLEWCTQAENVKYSFSENRRWDESPFTEKDIKDIRFKSKHLKEKGVKLAAEYGVAAGTIYRIINRESYKHII